MEPIEIRSASGSKQAIHFGAKGRPLFGFYHPPKPGSWRAVGVVLCRPIGTDQTRSDRVYRHLAERLAAVGFACLRFDLFGTGDSGGDERTEGLVRAWLDDVALAVAELRARSGARTIALFGLRLGATLAFVHAAERGDVDALVLWSPWVSGAKFVDEVTKLHKLYLSVEPQMTAAFPSRADGEEALGLFLPRALIEDLSRIDLLRTAGGQPPSGTPPPADPRRAGPGRPPILISNAGSVNRAGPHRLYVKMARRWAELGFDVLRIDLSGIGDSPVGPGARENLTYPPGALEDLDKAIRALGSERVIVVGLCSGGDYAFQLGAREPSVAGACMLNPRTFCVLDLAAVDSADDAPPSTPVGGVPRTLRRMADRGVDTLLVVSRNDPGVAYVDAHAGDAMRELASVSGFRRVDFGSADHTFTPIAAQERLNDVVMEHLLARY